MQQQLLQLHASATAEQRRVDAATRAALHRTAALNAATLSNTQASTALQVAGRQGWGGQQGLLCMAGGGRQGAARWLCMVYYALQCVCPRVALCHVAARIDPQADSQTLVPPLLNTLAGSGHMEAPL